MIVPMKHITLVGLISDEERILSALQEINAVEIIPPKDDESTDCDNNSTEREASPERKLLERFESALKSLSTVSSKGGGLLTPKPEVEAREFMSLDTHAEPVNLCMEIENVTSRIQSAEASIKQLSGEIESMRLWRDVWDVKVENIRSTKHTNMLAGTIPNKNIDALNDLPITVSLAGKNTNEQAVLLAFHKSDGDTVQRALRDAGFTEYAFPKDTGAPAQILSTLERDLENAKKQKAALIDKLQALNERKLELTTATDVQQARVELDMAREDVLYSESAFLLEAWVREDEALKVDEAVKSVTDAYYIEARDPYDDEIPPSVVKNNKYIEPFEAVTNMYSRPDPRGIDATPYMAPFYLLFFAMMLSDSGYGLLLFLGGLLFSKIKKPKGMMGALTKVITMGGLATVIVGPFIGTFFGMSFNELLLGAETGPFPLLMDPIKDAVPMLLLCCGLGVFQMMVGLGIKMYMFIKRNDTQTAIFDCLSWMFLVLGLIGMLALHDMAAPFAIFALVGAFMIVLFAGRAKKGIKRLTKGLGSLYDVTSYMSDIVSYARIFAMGLVTGAMGEVFNTLGGMLSGAFSGVLKIVGVIAAIAVLFALHGFSIFMNTLGSFSHTARLQYIEFYGKFYETGGREFKPLGFHPKKVAIK